MDSFASGPSEKNEESQLEDDHHVTQMQTIAGRQTLTKRLSRRLSRARSRSSVLPTGDTNLVIGVSVVEATVETPSTDNTPATPTTSAVVSSGSLQRKSSQISIGGSREPGNWISKARDLTQKFRRKSKHDLSDIASP